MGHSEDCNINRSRFLWNLQYPRFLINRRVLLRQRIVFIRPWCIYHPWLSDHSWVYWREFRRWWEFVKNYIIRGDQPRTRPQRVTQTWAEAEKPSLLWMFCEHGNSEKKVWYFGEVTSIDGSQIVKCLITKYSPLSLRFVVIRCSRCDFCSLRDLHILHQPLSHRYSFRRRISCWENSSQETLFEISDVRKSLK